MSKKRNKRNNKSVLKHLKAKRANFNRGGYGGYTDGSRNRSDSVPVQQPPVNAEPFIPGEEERDTYQDYRGDDYTNQDNNNYYVEELCKYFILSSY